MALKVYGLKNCDTTRKAVKLFEKAGRPVEFHDIREELPPRTLKEWIKALGWEALLNRRSTTWRQLSDAEKTDLNAAKAEALMKKYPTLIKRPVVSKDKSLELGFNEDRLSKL